MRDVMTVTNAVIKTAYITGIITANEMVLGYFESDLKKRRNTYKPKLKVTLEHKKEVSKLFQSLLSKELDYMKGGKLNES